jgi:hypothetical protein
LEQKRSPKSWDLTDAKIFVDAAMKLAKENKMEEEDLK